MFERFWDYAFLGIENVEQQAVTAILNLNFGANRLVRSKSFPEVRA